MRQNLIVRRLISVVRWILIKSGIRKHLVSPSSMTQVDLAHRISPDEKGGYVLVYDSLHTERGRVRMEVPFDKLSQRSEFISQSDLLTQLYLPDGEAYGGVAVSRLTGCLELTTLPNSDWLRSFYGSQFGNAPGAGEEAAHVGKEVRRKRSGDKVHLYIKELFERPGRVLDIGCGYGDQLAIFAAHDWETHGIEPNVMRGRVAREEYGIVVHTVGVEDLGNEPLPGLLPQSFDLVILNQVLEHLQDPHRTLVAAGALLKPGGFLFVAVPDLELETVHAIQNNFVHVRSYSGAALRAELGLAGFRVHLDAEVPGYNIVMAQRSPGIDVSGFVARAVRQARNHVSRAFSSAGDRERLVVVTHPIYGNRTLVYHWRGMIPSLDPTPGAVSIVTSGMVGSFKIVADGVED
jgi:SAM-dependent methyltransferase